MVTTETVSKNYAQRKREENQNSSLQKPTRKATVRMRPMVKKNPKKPKKRKNPKKTVTARLASHAKTALLDTVGKICRNSKLFFFTREEMQQTIA